MRTLSVTILLTLLCAHGSAAQNADDQDLRERDMARRRAGSTESRLPATIPRGYALVIGISRYRNLDESQQLNYAETDAAAMVRTLISQEGGAFPADNVRTLIGPQATLANIKDALENWLPSIAKADDRVVVYFAGHGFVERGVGYLAPYDVDPDRLASTGYPMKQLGEVLGSRVKARWKVLLADACHSGKITPETSNEAIDSQLSALPASFLTLTSTTEREQSHEDAALANGFGFFTYFLTQGWRGYADNAPCDGLITADEVIEYVRSNVRSYARERGKFQTPTAHGDYEPVMPLGVSKTCLSNPAQAPSMVGRAIVESNMDDVDVYVDRALKGRVNAGKPLILPGLAAGPHEFKGVRNGYQPDTKEILIAPGQDTTVAFRIRYAIVIKKSAVDLNEQGEALLLTKRSTLNPRVIVPTNRSQSDNDLRKARDLFTRALAEDARYSLAAYRLGQTYQLLDEQGKSVAAFRQALSIAPGYVEASIGVAGVLLESGDPDAAIRELNEAIRHDPDNDQVYSMLSRAFLDKSAWQQCVDMATQALALNPSNAEAHLWRADSLRHLAADAKPGDARRLQLFTDARDHYHEFINQTNFESSLASRIAYHAVGHGIGAQKHADREGSYKTQRQAGFLGLCITEMRVGLLKRAREYCEQALDYDENSATAHYVLANVYRDMFNENNSCGVIASARQHYEKTIRLNPDLDEARGAKRVLSELDGAARELKCRGA